MAVRIKAVTSRERGDIERNRVTAELCPVTNCSSESPLSPTQVLLARIPKVGYNLGAALARHFGGHLKETIVCPDT